MSISASTLGTFFTPPVLNKGSLYPATDDLGAFYCNIALTLNGSTAIPPRFCYASPI
ncbi:hypothetical protein L195_g031442 [Trifolium pratense]|uniref:Uncharacterized protein n=1 Tax=Trifolium pratense TaxID=57577 RepID=A0A2K3LAE3_TRIPR|nr:hypothetical protein L195_g031442 [Trifolium pratense]